MTVDNKISTGSCFLFLLNIIVGTGIFLNTVPLYFLLKQYSYLTYVCTGFLMIPVIWATYLLAHENSGLNLTLLFSKYFGSWNKILVPLYALSKFATTVIGMLFISSLLKNIFFNTVTGNIFNILFFLLIYFICSLLVYYDISINYMVQKMIVIIKLIPLCFIIFFFIFYYFHNSVFSYMLLSQDNYVIDWFKLLQGASITIFAFSGFESLFAINHLLAGNKRKGAFLLGMSFLSAWLMYILYQFCVGNLANYFLIDSGSAISFADFLEGCFSQVAFSALFILLINIAIMFSSLGVAHGVMYASVNNLFSSLTNIFGNIKKAKYFIFCLIPFYAALGLKNIFILQQLASLGTIITYGLFVFCYWKMSNRSNLLFFFSALSIFILLIFHFYNAFNNFGFLGYIVYGILIILLFCIKFFIKGV